MTKKSVIFLWISILVLSFYYTFTHLNFETNILKLLPKYDSQITSSLIDKASVKINDKLIVVVAGTSQEATRNSFIRQLATYKQSGLFKQIKSEVDLSQYQKLYQELLQYRYFMMAKSDRIAMERFQEFDYFIDMAIAQLYGLTGVSQNQINTDPLFFFNHIINQLSEFNNLRIEADDNMFHVFKNHKHHYFAFLQLKHSAFSPDYQQSIVTQINNSKNNLDQNINLYAFGSVLYAQQAYEQAKGEISTVGVGSLIGILLLFIFVFRSVVPLIVSVISIGLGLVFAFAVTVLVFDKVHLFALVFGSTIAGVSIDYCFHYLVESAINQPSKKIINHILPGLIIGFASSAMVYLGFILTGYQVLAQISLFSIFGLLGVLLNVVLFFPWLVHFKRIKDSHLLIKLANLILTNPFAKIFNSLNLTIVFFIMVLLLNWFLLRPNDDVRALQSLSGQLKIEEKYIKDVLALKTDSRYALVYADNINDLLETESIIINQLSTQSESIIGISDFIPPKSQQQEYWGFYKKLYSSNHFQSYISENGLDDRIITLQSQQFNENHKIKEVNFGLFEHSSIRDLLAQRWLGKVDDNYALAIPLFDGAKFNIPEQVVIVQQAEDASKLFGEFRQKSVKIVFISALMLILLLAWFRYGIKKATHIVLLPFIAGLTALITSQLFGFHVSLFSILAILLILGMGLDYVVFLTEAHKPMHVTFALILSSITTILSFGLLSLSQVAVIKSFGFTVALGILLILFLAPAIIQQGKNNAKQK